MHRHSLLLFQQKADWSTATATCFSTPPRTCFIVIILCFVISADGIPGTPVSTSCDFDPLCGYNFLSKEAEEPRDTRRLSAEVCPEQTSGLSALWWIHPDLPGRKEEEAAGREVNRRGGIRSCELVDRRCGRQRRSVLIFARP